MLTRYSRRDFLKLSSAALGGFAIPPLSLQPPIHPHFYPIGIGRVTTTVIYVYETPTKESRRTGKLNRDMVISILSEVMVSSQRGPDQLWYQISGGYVHSSYIQRVDSLQVNSVLESIPLKGLLAEVTVPYTQCVQFHRSEGWQPGFRLYFQSTHWIKTVDAGPDGEAWYRIHDLRMNSEYHARAIHLRPINLDEYSPLSPEIPTEEKHIEIDIAAQTLTAFEGERVVYRALVSSGLPSLTPPVNGIPTETPLGNFHIQLKMPSSHMGDGHFTADPEAYELPGVPWTCVFHTDGIALHGTYWHNYFGHRMSHGCINLKNPDAKWLFRWTDPVFQGKDYFQQGRGTLVKVT